MTSPAEACRYVIAIVKQYTDDPAFSRAVLAAGDGTTTLTEGGRSMVPESGGLWTGPSTDGAGPHRKAGLRPPSVSAAGDGTTPTGADE